MDYFSLPLNQRADLLKKEGKLLTSASHYAHRVNLYSYKGEFIEVWYNAITDEIEKIIPMGKQKLFRKYFEQN